MTFACSRIGACVSSPHACTSTGRPLAAAKQRRARHRTPRRVHMLDQGVLLESTLRDSRGGLISSGRWNKERSSRGWVGESSIVHVTSRVLRDNPPSDWCCASL